MKREEDSALPDVLTREQAEQLVMQAVAAEREAAIAYLKEIADIRKKNNSTAEPYAQMAACLARGEHRSRARARASKA